MAVLVAETEVVEICVGVVLGIELEVEVELLKLNVDEVVGVEEDNGRGRVPSAPPAPTRVLIGVFAMDEGEGKREVPPVTTGILGAVPV